MNKKILKLVEQRLLVGEKKYGNENVTNDGRDFIKEALEESLDLAVYVAARLIEIEKKEKQMGARIEIENKQEKQGMEIKELKKELKELQDVVAELSNALMHSTQVHHVDLTEDVKKVEGVVLEPDEEYTVPVGKRKKTTRKVKAASTT